MSQNHTPHENRDDGLELLFAQARAEAPDPLPDALRARLVEAAVAACPAAPAPAPGPGWLARLAAALANVGGAPGVAGLGAAGLAGVWIGFAGPGVSGDLMTRFWQGAASVSPAVSALVDGDLLTTTDTPDLLALMSGQIE